MAFRYTSGNPNANNGIKINVGSVGQIYVSGTGNMDIKVGGFINHEDNSNKKITNRNELHYALRLANSNQEKLALVKSVDFLDGFSIYGLMSFFRNNNDRLEVIKHCCKGESDEFRDEVVNAFYDQWKL